MLNEHILSITLATPLLGALVIALLPRQGRAVPWCAFLVSLLTFAFTLHLPSHYDYGTRSFQFVENYFWIQNPNIHYHLGVDGISLWLVVLTGFLAPLGVLVSWNAIATRTKEFYFFYLLQQTAMLGVFVSLDLFLYYGFWELSLVPMAILIAMFGRTRGPAAAIKFFLYTFIPSALFLVGILYLYVKTGTFDFVELQAMLAGGHLAATATALSWTAFAFLFAFAVKVPVFPLHGWIGDVYSEAPTAMAMVVAGKLGLYSLIRFNLGLFPAQSREFAPWMIALSVIGILYGSLNALVQKDLKRVVAFGTVAALSFCTLGIFCFSIAGLDGAVYQTINEGIIGGSLLCLLGILHERYGTYETAAYGGLAARLPWMVSFLRHHRPRAGRPADSQRLCRRIPGALDCFRHAPGLGRRCHRRRYPERGLLSLDDAASLLRPAVAAGAGARRHPRSCRPRARAALAVHSADAHHGRGLALLVSRY